jgi:hypothetical protein
MKAIGIVELALAILVAARLSGAQVLNIDVGVPLGGSWNPGTPIVIIKEEGTENSVTPIGDPAFFSPAGISTAIPGDIIFTNGNNPGGGDAPSNWLADLRFFNPLDPTGILGLPATETEAFFPADLGPGGFDSFQLMPEYNFLQASPGFTEVVGGEVVFGPAGGILPGQQADIVLVAFPGSPAAGTPEPGGMALLFGVGIVGVGLLVHRCRWFSHANRFQTPCKGTQSAIW